MRKLLLLTLLAAGLNAADITGKWSGTIKVSDPSSGTVVDTPVRAEFIQKADLISGSIGRKEDERAEPIQNAKLEGDSLVFEVRTGETEGSVKFNLKVVNAGHIEGDMKGMVDVGPITGKVTLEKEK